MKYCNVCGKETTLDYFYKRSASKDGLAHCCKNCSDIKVTIWAESNESKIRETRRKAHIKSCYGLIVAEYDNLLSIGCAICGEVDIVLCIDHDHSCCAGKRACRKCIRGVLCKRHNSGLGFFQDSIKELENAIKYLKKDVTK